MHCVYPQSSVRENQPTDNVAVVVNFTITDGDRSVMASQLGDVGLVGTDARYFTAEITGPASGQILTKYV